MALRKFLSETRARLPLSGGPVHAVIGNEAADADSIIATITTAYLRHHTYLRHADPTQLPPTVPVVPCARADLCFRPETVKLLSLCNIEMESLIHVEDVDLRGIFDRGELALTLTDHNDGSLQQNQGLGSAVIEIIDHHADAGKLQHIAAEMRRIEPLGSACTLVAELYFSEAPQLLDVSVRTLLAGVILLDTNNFLNLDKTKPRDRQALQKLCESDGIPHGLYDQLQFSKCDPAYWSTIGTYDLLRTDFKAFETSGQRYGIASINGGVGDLAQLSLARGAASVREAFARYAADTGIEVLIAMCCYPDGPGGWSTAKRDVIIYCPSVPLRSGLATHLSDHDAVQLQALPECAFSAFHDIQMFRQLKTDSSRKQLQPVVDKWYSTVRPSL